MITKTELSNVWNQIAPIVGKNVGRRADASHPLDFFISYDESSHKQLMLLAEQTPALPKSSRQINVRDNIRADGKHAICFSLLDDKLSDQYVFLCWDLMDCTYEMNDKKAGIRAAIRRFGMWQKLFAEAQVSRISDERLKGLIGELLVLKKICLPKYGSKAIGGWIGPLGADRDFEYADCWYESKYISLSRDEVQISSLDQLDIDVNGYLVLCRTEKTGDNAVNSFSVNSLVDEILLYLDNEEAKTVFFSKLSLIGYQRSDDRVEEKYISRYIERYLVQSGFPRLRRSEIAEEIVNGTYSLSIPALAPWKIEE